MQALDALAAWAQSEPSRVGPVLAKHAQRVGELFGSLKGDAFVNLLEPLLKILQLAPDVARELVQTHFIPILLSHLSDHNALVRVMMLKLLSALNAALAVRDRDAMVKKYRVIERVSSLKEDRAVLVNEMASRLLETYKEK